MAHRVQGSAGVAGTASLPQPIVSAPVSSIRQRDPQWEADVANPARRFAFYFGLGFIFVRFSMLHEALSFSLGMLLPILYPFAVPALLGVVLTGGLRRTFRQLPAYLWMGFVGWMLLATLFSSWPGGSVPFVTAYVKTQLPCLFIIAGLVMTWRECVLVANTIALGAFANLLLSKILSGDQGGRVSLDIAQGSIGNPNDLAAHLILVLPFLIAFAFRPGKGKLIRAGVVLCLAYGLFVILGTASRGALVALAGCSVFAFFFASMVQRMAVIVLLPLAAVGLFAILPASTRARLTNFSTEPVLGRDEAAESAAARTYLLKRALQFTFEKPLFGVGPGQFMSYEGGESKSEGRRGAWHNAHNSYVQLACENGIPAFLFAVTALFGSFRLLNRTRKKALQYGERAQEISTMLFFVTLGMIGFSIAIFFLNFYPAFYMPAMIGFIIALVCAAEKEMSAFPMMQPAPAPVRRFSLASRNRTRTALPGKNGRLQAGVATSRDQFPAG